MSAVYDAGALIAADRNDRVFWADHRARLEKGTPPVAPAPVVAQASRSSRQVQLRRLLRGCQVVPLDEAGAHDVGRLLARAGTGDIADAAVVVQAVVRGAAIVTTDPDDIARLLAAVDADIPVIAM